MKCRHVCNLASQYLSGELPPEKMAAIEAHAAECSSCRAEVAATERALRALERPKPLFEPPDVLEAVKMQVARPSRSFGTGRVGWAFAGAAAILLAAWLAASLSPARHAPPASPGVMESQAPNTPIARETAKPMPNPVAAGTAPANARDDAKASRPQRAPDKIRKPEGRSISHPKPEPIRAAPEPTIEYVVVYTPEPPEPEAAGTAFSEAGEAIPPDTAYYSIRMTDNSSGEITTLSVRTEIEPGAEPNIIMDYAVTGMDTNPDDIERSLFDENSPIHDTHPAHSAIG